MPLTSEPQSPEGIPEAWHSNVRQRNDNVVTESPRIPLEEKCTQEVTIEHGSLETSVMRSLHAQVMDPRASDIEATGKTLVELDLLGGVGLCDDESVALPPVESKVTQR